MLKQLLVLALLVACAWGEHAAAAADAAAPDARASKTKKKLARIIVMALIFLFSKIAIFKVATFFFFMAFFQKLFALGGVLLAHVMRSQAAAAAGAPLTQAAYGAPAPAEYNTLGYSYGAPDHELDLPSIATVGNFATNLGGAFNWLSGKQ